MQISKQNYGTLKDGRDVHIFTLVNQQKQKVQITNYGGIIVSFEVLDNEGTVYRYCFRKSLVK
jgi:aldose 1-epimerase